MAGSESYKKAGPDTKRSDPRPDSKKSDHEDRVMILADAGKMSDEEILLHSRGLHGRVLAELSSLVQLAQQARSTSSSGHVNTPPTTNSLAQLQPAAAAAAAAVSTSASPSSSPSARLQPAAAGVAPGTDSAIAPTTSTRVPVQRLTRGADGVPLWSATLPELLQPVPTQPLQPAPFLLLQPAPAQLLQPSPAQPLQPAPALLLQPAPVLLLQPAPAQQLQLVPGYGGPSLQQGGGEKVGTGLGTKERSEDDRGGAAPLALPRPLSARAMSGRLDESLVRAVCGGGGLGLRVKRLN